MQSRTSKATIAALLALLIVVVRGAQRQRRAFTGRTLTDELATVREARRARRQLHALVLMVLGNWVGDTLGNLVGFFTDIPGRIWDAITTVVDWAAGLLLDAINWVYANLSGAITAVVGALQGAVQGLVDLIGQGINGVLGVIRGVQNLLQSAIDGVAHLLSIVADDLRTAIGNALSAALDFARSVGSFVFQQAKALVDGALSFVGGLITDLWHGLDVLRGWAATAISDAITALRDYVVPFIGGLVSDLWHGLDVLRGWAATAISDAISGLHDLFFAALDALRNDILGPLTDLLAWIRDHAYVAVQVVEEVIGWLVWLAKLPFESATDIAHAWRDLSPRHVADNIGAVTHRTAPLVDRHLRDAMGLEGRSVIGGLPHV